MTKTLNKDFIGVSSDGILSITSLLSCLNRYLDSGLVSRDGFFNFMYCFQKSVEKPV